MSEKFWAKVKRGAPDECWPWTGYARSSGHGLTSYKSVPTHASRKAWNLTHGPAPAHLCVNHRCDNPICCNPDHLYLGTRADNMLDVWTRRPAAERSAYGRAYALDDGQLLELYEMRRRGSSLRECAYRFGVHISTVCRYVTIVRKARAAKLRLDRLSVSQK